MSLLFEIKTTAASLRWTAPHDAQRPGRAGLLQIKSFRKDANLFVNRCTLPMPASSDIQIDVGPLIQEETNYKIYLRSLNGQKIRIKSRDPLITRDLSHEDDETLQHGYINFGSQIGKTEFWVLVNTKPEFSFVLEVFPSKLDYEEDYDSILAELQDATSGLALQYLQSTYKMGFQFSDGKPTGLEWITILRHVLSDLEKAINFINQRPYRRFIRYRMATRPEKIRRVDSVLRSSWRKNFGTMSVDKKFKLPESKPLATLDSAEHRWLAQQIQEISRRLAALIEVEERAEERKDSSLRRKKILEELHQFQMTIGRMLKSEIITAAEGPAPQAFASLQLIGAPGYSEAYRNCILLQYGLRIGEGFFRTSIKNLAELYEYWCFLKLLKVISTETERPINPKEIIKTSKEGLRVALKKGQETKIQFKAQKRCIEAIYNPRFSNDSMLVAQKPDMIITIRDPEWPIIRLLLDAKYRLDTTEKYINSYGVVGPPEDALNVLYRYRDAITEFDDREDRPTRTIIEAAILFPYHPGKDYRHCRIWESFERSGVGAIPLLPNTLEYLENWIANALKMSGWKFASRAIENRTTKHAANWFASASVDVLIGTLKPEIESAHLDWIEENHRYYTPLKRGRRQLGAKWIAFYTTAAIKSGVSFYSKVKNIRIVRRNDVSTPWVSSRPDSLVVLYDLGKIRKRPSPILNLSGTRLSVNRWTSKLAFDRATNIEELLLRTSIEWRLYEELNLVGMKPKLKSESHELRHYGKVLFLFPNDITVRYAGPAGIELTTAEGKKHYLPDVPELIQNLKSIS